MPGRQQDKPAGKLAVEGMGDAPVIGVYDVLPRWQGGGRLLLVAGEASRDEAVGVHPGTLDAAASPLTDLAGVSGCV